MYMYQVMNTGNGSTDPVTSHATMGITIRSGTALHTYIEIKAYKTSLP